jgi:acyl-CoA thioesterase I
MKNNIQTIAVYGDSILKGVITGTSEKRFELVKENSLALAGTALGIQINNRSAFGNIITKNCGTLAYDLDRGVTADAAIIESGGNDCDRDWIALSSDPENPPDHRTPLPLFIKTIESMVATLRAHKITPILMTMPPLVADRYYRNICITGDEQRINEFLGGDCFHLYRIHERYNMALMACAQKLQVQLIDMRQAFLDYEYQKDDEQRLSPERKSHNQDWSDLMCADGIHPNLSGYAFMAKIWETELPLLKKEF